MKVKIILMRFIRGFISGGIASLLALFSTGTVISSMAEFKDFVYALAIAFLTGGLMAIDKLIRWEE